MRNKKELIGKRFGRLVILDVYENVRDKNSHGYKCLCKCDCGKTTEKWEYHLKSGAVKSCGCLHSEITEKNNKGRTTINVTENKKAYFMWKDMIKRCSDSKCSNYHHYGARGISVCDEWKDFKNFLKWLESNGFDKNMGRECSIERIDVNGDYSPQNCKIAGIKEQQNNKTDNHYIIINGKTMTVTQWCEITGVKRSVAYDRIKNGWAEEDAVTLAPSHKKRYRRSENGQKERTVQLQE